MSSRDLISRKSSDSNSNNSDLSQAFVAQCQQMARANQAALAAAATAMAALAAASSNPNPNPNSNPNANANLNPNLNANLNLNLNPNANPNANYLSTLLSYYYHNSNNLINTFNCNNLNTNNLNNVNNNNIPINNNNHQSRPLVTIHSHHQDQRLIAPPPIDATSERLLSSLYEMNDEPSDDAIKLIAERINSSYDNVATYFHHRRQADRQALKDALSNVDWSQQSAMLNNIVSPTSNNIVSPNNVPCMSPFETEKPHPPSAPSSTLLAKLTAVTSRPNAHIMARQLDPKMIDLLEAFYTINDNPEPSAIEMIAKRINSSVDLVADWFESKRAKLNPHVGPRSPPAKKREGGRVVTFSEYQRSLLEAIFDENNYLHPQEYEELSNLIQVPARNIKIWFKNRRSKQRLSGRITVSGVH